MCRHARPTLYAYTVEQLAFGEFWAQLMAVQRHLHINAYAAVRRPSSCIMESKGGRTAADTVRRGIESRNREKKHKFQSGCRKVARSGGSATVYIYTERNNSAWCRCSRPRLLYCMHYSRGEEQRKRVNAWESLKWQHRAGVGQRVDPWLLGTRGRGIRQRCSTRQGYIYMYIYKAIRGIDPAPDPQHQRTGK